MQFTALSNVSQIPFDFGNWSLGAGTRKVAPFQMNQVPVDPRTVHPVASRYTDLTIPAHCLQK
jgi:hypothetical protein